MFFVVGAGKAGTTWLHDYLSSHDQVSCGPTKEYSYFNYFWRTGGDGKRPFVWWNTCLAQMSLARRTGAARGYVGSLIYTLRNPLDYKETLRGKDPLTRAFGDVSPRYATLGAEAFAEMKSMHPRTKFVFVMRDPVDRLWSAAQMKLRNPRYKRRAAKADFLMTQLDDKLVFESMNYPRTVEALFQSVPEDDIIIMFYETMFEQAEIDRLCSELGVEAREAQFEKRVYAETKGEMPVSWARAMYLELKHMYQFVEQRFPAAIPDYWKHKANDYERAV